jgi:hypothetical protein
MVTFFKIYRSKYSYVILGENYFISSSVCFIILYFMVSLLSLCVHSNSRWPVTCISICRTYLHTDVNGETPVKNCMAPYFIACVRTPLCFTMTGAQFDFESNTTWTKQEIVIMEHTAFWNFDYHNKRKGRRDHLRRVRSNFMREYIPEDLA